jgi:hypothetical protein
MARFYTPSRISENIRETPEGYLVCVGVPIARTGWQEYGAGETPLEVGDEGVVRVYRDPKEVFRPQTIASFQGKSVTVRHPEDFVKPSNWKILTNGTIQNVRKGEEEDDGGNEMLISDLLITDEFTIGLVKNGLREVSCGYDAEYEETGDGEGRQFNILGNHVALVEAGRAGTSYAIKDHKGRTDEMSKLKEVAEMLKNLVKTVDSAVEEGTKKPDAKEEKKTEKKPTKDEGYDAVIKAVKDLEAKMSKGKDEDKAEDEAEDEEKEEKAKDADEESSTGARLDKLEAAIAKLLERATDEEKKEEEKSEDADEEEKSEDADEEEKSEDADEEEKSEDEDMTGDEDEESEDADEEEEKKPKKTGDAARIEILTPGKKFEGKDARAKCLASFSKTEDGKKVLAQLGVKKFTADEAKNADTLFLAASALVRTKRGVGLDGVERAKARYTADDVENTASEPITAEKMNELNAKLYSSAK